MNTTKQVNVMIGLLMLSIIVFGGYMARESFRQEEQREINVDGQAELGAELFVNNCRPCHGMEGEGHIGPPLNSHAFLILGADNAEGLPVTPQGEADAVNTFLFNTISCGRTGTFMPTWSNQFGGSLSPTQINQIIALITNGRWELVKEIGDELDTETGRTAADVLVDVAKAPPSVTEKNCGQYTPDQAADIHSRDPLVAPTATVAAGAVGTGTATTTATAVAAAPGTVNVELLDTLKLTAAPAQEPGGKVTFHVQNKGQIQHELKVIKTDLAPEGLPVANGTVDEKQVTIVTKTPLLGGGKSQDISADLQAGKYVLICNVPAHYGAGMRMGFTVQ